MEFLSPVIKEELAREADEVTYPAHVIMRHDLEQKLIDGTLLPRDVPAAWAKGMRDLLGRSTRPRTRLHAGRAMAAGGRSAFSPPILSAIWEPRN